MLITNMCVFERTARRHGSAPIGVRAALSNQGTHEKRHGRPTDARTYVRMPLVDCIPNPENLAGELVELGVSYLGLCPTEQAKTWFEDQLTNDLKTRVRDPHSKLHQRRFAMSTPKPKAPVAPPKKAPAVPAKKAPAVPATENVPQPPAPPGPVPAKKAPAPVPIVAKINQKIKTKTKNEKWKMKSKVKLT